MRSADRLARLLLLPIVAFTAAFLIVPLARLVLVAGQGPAGGAEYLAALTNPRYFHVLVATLLLSLAVTATTLVLGTIVALFVGRRGLSRPFAAYRSADLAACLSRGRRRFHGHLARRPPGGDRRHEPGARGGGAWSSPIR